MGQVGSDLDQDPTHWQAYHEEVVNIFVQNGQTDILGILGSYNKMIGELMKLLVIPYQVDELVINIRK